MVEHFFFSAFWKLFILNFTLISYLNSESVPSLTQKLGLSFFHHTFIQLFTFSNIFSYNTIQRISCKRINKKNLFPNVVHFAIKFFLCFFYQAARIYNYTNNMFSNPCNYDISIITCVGSFGRLYIMHHCAVYRFQTPDSTLVVDDNDDYDKSQNHDSGYGNSDNQTTGR